MSKEAVDKGCFDNNKTEYFIQRYLELQGEIQSCYEEYREARHLQASVITACGALLGIITGTSIYSQNLNCIKFNIPAIFNAESKNPFMTMLSSMVNTLPTFNVTYLPNSGS